MGDTEEKRALAKAIDEARKQQKAMSEVFARLAASSSPDRRLERALRERQTERDESLRAVGEALLHWIAAGGSLTDGSGASKSALNDDFPEDDDDTGETVFSADPYTTDSPTITRRRRRVVDTNRVLPPDPDSLKTLAESFGNHEAAERPDAMSAVRAFMDSIGDAEPPSTPLEFLDGIQRLARVSDRTDRWKRLPRRVQQLFLAYGTCKARVWQENLDLGSSRHEVVLEQVFRALTRYSARERPGFVHGLSRSHRPERETWADDSHYWWTELCLAANIDPEPSNTEKQLDELNLTLAGKVSDPVVQAAVMHAIQNGVPATDPRLLKLLAPRADALKDEPRLRTVRRALRDEDEEPGDDQTEEAPLVGPDWPWLHITQGKEAVVFGGDARPEATERIRATFQFDDVQWSSDTSERKVNSLAKRIKNGSIGMVFFLARFSSHSAQTALRDACKDAGVPFVRIEHGYGVQQLKLAIESWMHGKQ